MNIRVILFSGIMTALIGAMIGIAVGHISNRQPRKIVILSGGAIVGFVLGSAQEAIRQQNRQRSEQEEETAKDGYKE